MKAGIATVTWLLIQGCVSCAQPQRAQPQPALVKLETVVGFRCLWWSEDQKGKFNPNSPPPKTTEIEIQKWEYSDPVEVPHPDVVDVVAEVRNQSTSAAEDSVVAIEIAWQIGPLRDQAKANWETPAEILRRPGVRIKPGESLSFRVPVDVAKKMAQLRTQSRWPWALRARVKVTARNGEEAGHAEAKLPITPGD